MQSLDQGEISPVASERNAPISNSRERKHHAILRSYVEDNDDKSRYFRDVNLHKACDVFSGDFVTKEETPSLQLFLSYKIL